MKKIVGLAGLLLLATPLCAQGRGEIAVGVGLAIGVRTGPVVSVSARGGGDAGVLCRAGGFIRASAISCGATLWFSDRQLAVAEAGLWIGRERAIRGPVPVNRVFLSLGTGIVGDGGESARPVYDVGAAVYVARWDADGWSGDAGWSGYGDLRAEWVVDRRDR
jgi:hypothetical protein